jgi:hypothetical protein
MSDDRVWFGSHWDGSEVEFTKPNLSTWILVKKVSERYIQRTKEEHEECKSPSYAWALFQCEDRENPDHIGFMKIYLQ